MENANLETSETKHEADTPQENGTTNQLNKLKAPTAADGPDKVSCCKKHTTKPRKSKSLLKSKKNGKKAVQSSDSESTETSSSSSSEGSQDSDNSDSESESSDSDERRKKRRKARARAKKQKHAKRKSRSKKHAVDSSTDDPSDTSDNNDDSSVKEKTSKKSAKAKAMAKAKAKKAAKQKAEEEAEPDDVVEDDPNEARLQAVEAKLARLSLSAAEQETPAAKRRARRARRAGVGHLANRDVDSDEAVTRKKARSGKSKKNKRASKIAFKRVDQLWDSSIHNYKLTETVDDPDADEWDQYIFTVRRQFDWEHKYESTFVDVRSKPLKDALEHVMQDVKGVSLVQDTPQLDPNMLFLYLEEMRTYTNELKTSGKKEKKKKARNAAAMKAQHLKVLVKYLDKDFAEIKKTLYPLLENDMITFDLLWALYKPNTVVYTSTYNDNEQPRAFKLEYATKESSFTNGIWYSVEGRYLEYDGKAFGMGTMHANVPSFKGSRKVSSLACYPIKFHKNVEELKAKLIERGKKFVALKGMNYRFHKGMAYMKKKSQVLKININGRIMVDPAIHRRINPNYQVSTVKPKEEEEYFEMSDDSGDDSCGCCGDSSTSEAAEQDKHTPLSDESKPRKRFKVVEDENGDYQVVEVKSDNEEEEITPKKKLDSLAQRSKEDSFTDDELLIASPVVLGFTFSEKLWLEFTVSGIYDVEWNEGAYDSLVLPENHKSIVKSLVTSHKFSAAKNIDDVISGKGKGLVAVLHGPPGTGKTLTAEGIAELLKCPLYMVSAGELGTDPRVLERSLTDILDIAHAWGAVLLLDEADVFLEKRSIHDIHRNALVSIFLRLLEYFQGILFLTTNRVETFDDAFQSRIHVALKYGELTTKAKRSVWKMFVEKVRKVEGVEVAEFKDADFDMLAKHNLNGRQIKNSTRAAQALALSEAKPLSMSHLTRVLQVAQSFEQDLKGGTGYEDAMRSYT